MSKRIATSNDAAKAEKVAKNAAKVPMQTAIEQGAVAPEASVSAPEPEVLPAPEPEVPAVDDVVIEEPAEVAAPAIEETEAAYGLERLNDLLGSPETFLAELKQGVEPAVAEAIYAAVIASKNGKTKRSYSSTMPHLARSTCKDPVAKVWEIASSMPGAQRKDVIVACVTAGVATSTAHTQYQAWKAAGKLGASRKAG